MAAQRDQWGPHRHCRSPASTAMPAGVFFIDDLLTGTSPISTCGLAITTNAGTFVDVPKRSDGSDRCEGLLGPTHGIHTEVEALAWNDDHLELRVREMVRWWHAKGGETSRTQTLEKLVVCSLSSSGIPRCTPPIAIGCSDASTGHRSLTWKLEGDVLRLRPADPGAKSPAGWPGCDVGAPLVVGDFVVW